VVVCEAVDRLGRKLADVAALHDRLEFRRVRLHAVNLGVVTTMHVGLLGTMAQLHLSDLKEKTRRGLSERVLPGRVLQGKAAGRRAYGYRLVQDGGERGGRRVEPGEAAVVRRILMLYAAGTSNAIARALNGENVPGPGGRPWHDSTIAGQRDRGTGLLNSELYAGRLVWNRCSYVEDPRSGRRLARPNPPERGERVAVPGLRIVDDALWDAAKARQAAPTQAVATKARCNPLNAAHLRQRPHRPPAGDRGPDAGGPQAPAAGARAVRGLPAPTGRSAPPRPARPRRSGPGWRGAWLRSSGRSRRSCGQWRTACTSRR
jgi:hypothetical protein